MTLLNLRYVQRFEDRHGKVRHYFRRPGSKRVTLPGQPGSPEFLAAYQAAIGSEVVPQARAIGVDRVKPGSIAALIVSFYSSPGFRNRADITRRNYRNVLEHFRKEHGHKSAAGLRKDHVEAMLAGMTPGAAYSLRRVLKLIMAHAVKTKMRADNPLLAMEKAQRATVGHRTWEETDIQRYEKHWKVGSRERLALDLLLYVGCRRKDLVGLGRQMVRDGVLTYTPSKDKTKTPLHIPIHPSLKASLDAAPKDQMTFLQTQYGAPFSPAGFTNWFVESAKAAGLTGLTPHGLRKACCRRLAEAGCTANEIMAITGHKNVSEVTTYTKAADQKKLAQNAMKRVSENAITTEIVKPSQVV